MKRSFGFIAALIAAAVTAFCALPAAHHDGTGLFAVDAAADDDYGVKALEYMEHISQTYPGRWWNSQTNNECCEYLKSEIAAMGYDCRARYFEIEKNGYTYFGENLEFEIKGESPAVILVGAHYDCVDNTSGPDDNASGVGLLLEEAARLAGAKDLPYTVRFVLFDCEEEVALGSIAYVRDLEEHERSILCMINLDSICAGDYMYIYGGHPEADGSVSRTWAALQALDAADALGLDMHFHPDVNAQFPTPSKHTDSDQQPFDAAGVPYIYFEASNWNGGNHTNFYQTADPDVVNGKMFHVPEYENMEFYRAHFGDRIEKHLAAYGKLLDFLLREMAAGSTVCVVRTEPQPPEYTTAEEPATQEVTSEYTTEEVTTQEAATEETTTAEETTQEVTTEEATTVEETTTEVTAAESTQERSAGETSAQDMSETEQEYYFGRETKASKETEDGVGEFPFIPVMATAAILLSIMAVVYVLLKK
ncbi:MAG: M28 family peptidase [Lachnospiraceae bacterium]|nr:M28 family peptidase [Lachnospiraceae bacterium]